MKSRIGVAERSKNQYQGIYFDAGEKLITQSFSLASALYEATDIDKFGCGVNDLALPSPPRHRGGDRGL